MKQKVIAGLFWKLLENGGSRGDPVFGGYFAGKAFDQAASGDGSAGDHV